MAYIKKNCWNLGDLTVNFRGARKARARLADVPSSFTPPPPSTSTTPAPAKVANNKRGKKAKRKREIKPVK